MNPSAAKYVVSCTCGDVAFLYDSREGGGKVEVRGPWYDTPGEFTYQLVAVDPPIRFSSRPDLNAYIESRVPENEKNASRLQSKYNVSHIVWKSGRQSWAIRCMQCELQVQVSESTLLSVCNALRDVRTELDCRLTAGPGKDRSESEHYVVPLGVLNRMVLRFDA